MVVRGLLWIIILCLYDSEAFSGTEDRRLNTVQRIFCTISLSLRKFQEFGDLGARNYRWRSNSCEKYVFEHLNDQICMYYKQGACMSAVTSTVSDSLWPYGLLPARPLCSWDSPGKDIGVGCHAHLQGLFLTQGSNPHLLWLQHCRWVLLLLSQQGSHL